MDVVGAAANFARSAVFANGAAGAGITDSSQARLVVGTPVWSPLATSLISCLVGGIGGEVHAVANPDAGV